MSSTLHAPAPPWAYLFLLAVVLTPVSALGEERTIFSGVFTEEQAARGKAVFMEQCAVCHGPTGRGGPDAPGLTGATLNTKYRGIPLSSYFQFMKDTMPKGRPGSLSDVKYADMLAYLLQSHGAPPGTEALPTEISLLDQIVIERKPQ